MVVRIDNSTAANHQIIKKKKNIQVGSSNQPQGKPDEISEARVVQSTKDGESQAVQIGNPEIIEKMRASGQN